MPLLNKQKLLDSLIKVPNQQAVLVFVNQLEAEISPALTAVDTLKSQVVDLKQQLADLRVDLKL